MKLVKSLLLGAPAAVMAFAGAQAADLPSHKAAPVAYVKICDAYGAGFFYIPGTDTCLKVGGYVRAQYEYTPQRAMYVLPRFSGTTGSYGGPANTPGYYSKNATDATGWMARGRVDLDARTQSAWGTVRTVIGLRAQQVSGMFNGPAIPAGGNGGGAVTVEAAFVQFAGFTAGRAGENFAFMPPFTWTGQHQWAGYPAGIKQLAYTATFGGGFSATIALEDRADFAGFYSAGAIAPGGVGANGAFAGSQNAAGVFSNYATALATGIAAGATVPYAPNSNPNTTPAVVGNLRVDQAWGSAQVMGSFGQMRGVSPAFGGNAAGQIYQPVPGADTSVSSKYGWAIGAGLKFNLPMLAAGDALYLTAAYANGFLDQIQGEGASTNNFDSYQNSRGVNRYDPGLWILPNGAGGTSTATTKAWSVGALLVHYWAPQWRSVLAASYAQYTPPGQVRAADWTNGGLSNARVTELSGSLIWAPVTNFDIGLELAYRKISQSINCNTIASCAAFASFSSGGTNGVNGTASTAKVSPGDLNARLRIQRTF